MRNLITLITALFLAIIPSLVFAQADQSIYETEVLVPSQTEKDRNPAEKTALEQVLVKASGNSNIMEKSPKLRASLDEAADLVQEFTYSPAPDATRALPFLLTVHFDPEAVNRLLRAAGSPVWGQSRPEILVWLVYEAPGDPADIVPSSDDTIPPALQEAARRRGLPFIFPMMDVTELGEVAVDDVVTRKVATLQAASQRYASNGILIGHIIQTKKGVSSQWQLVLTPDQWSWNLDGKNLYEVFTGVVNNVTDTLAGRYSTATTSAVQAQISLSVIGVKGQADVLQLMQYLQHLTPVADVQLRSVNGSQIMLDVTLRGGRDSFIQAVALGRNLLPISGGNAQDQSLRYQWIP